MKLNLLYFTISCLFIFLCFPNDCIYAQVTIGSNSQPIKGALLQLKENENIGANSMKGMLLPRIKLKNLNNLKDIDPDNINRPDPDMHIGLIVFNTDPFGFWSLNPMPNSAIINKYTHVCPGIFVWSGTVWEPLGSLSQPIETSSTLTDTDGNVYTIHTFGDAGTWMTQNLRRVLDPQCEIDTLQSFYYPNNDKELFERHPEYGLLYRSSSLYGGGSYNNYNSGFGFNIPTRQETKLNEDPSNGEIESFLKGRTWDSAAVGAARSICPQGWHIPTDREWTMLEKELSTNRHKYSSELVATIPWDDTWEDVCVETIGGSCPHTHSRGDYGWAMINPNIPENASADVQLEGTTHGTSNIDGTGFNAYLVGRYTEESDSLFYGTRAYFASFGKSANGSREYYLTRQISWGKSSGPNKGTSALTKGFFSPFYDSSKAGVSVRCRKDDW